MVGGWVGGGCRFKAKGFTTVRVPVQWGHHLDTSPPYAVNASFMDRVEQVRPCTDRHPVFTHECSSSASGILHVCDSAASASMHLSPTVCLRGRGSAERVGLSLLILKRDHPPHLPPRHFFNNSPPQY